MASALWTPPLSCEPADALVLRGAVRISSYDAATGALRDVIEASNVICTVGATALLHMLAADGVPSSGITYLAVGTGTAAPAQSDTQLGSELARQALTQALVSGRGATLQVFFTSVQANGSWTEVGSFGNGATAAANSGTLFGHAALSYTKTSSLETILAYTLTLS